MIKYRIIIYGPRDYTKYKTVKSGIISVTKDMEQGEIEIVSGGCDVPGVLTFTRSDGTKVYGADGLGERLAEEMGWPVKPFPANWKKHGRSAGPIRNRQMAEYATHARGFWDILTKGTNSMKTLAEQFSLK
jgi:hypothetical protein